MADRDVLDERQQLREQTRRNLEGMQLEQSGRVDLAIELYEQNLEEGFEGDWPYVRLVAYYERLGRPKEAARVLERAIDVFKGSKRRTPEDRRAAVKGFRDRLRQVNKTVKRLL